MSVKSYGDYFPAILFASTSIPISRRERTTLRQVGTLSYNAGLI